MILTKFLKEFKRKKNYLLNKKFLFVQEALEFYFDLRDIKVAKKRLNKFKKGETKAIPLEKVLREFTHQNRKISINFS